MLFNLLTSVIIWFYDRIKYITSKPNYKIIDKSMEYHVNNRKVPEDIDGFWVDEYVEWDGKTESFYKDLNDVDYRYTSVPNNVNKTVIRIKYWYMDKIYKFLTYDMNHKWPPENTPGIVFNIPIVSAKLLDSDDKPVKDLLNKIKRYAGPRGDFHGQKVKISDMLYYDEEMLEQELPYIKIKNALGLTKTLSTENDYITDLRIP
tara:strand:+ start:1011 stop:1622 length:612 start_codon:yes stop_codon:yes gene_type:complete